MVGKRVHYRTFGYMGMILSSKEVMWSLIKCLITLGLEFEIGVLFQLGAAIFVSRMGASIQFLVWSLIVGNRWLIGLVGGAAVML